MEKWLDKKLNIKLASIAIIALLIFGVIYQANEISRLKAENDAYQWNMQEGIHYLLMNTDFQPFVNHLEQLANEDYKDIKDGGMLLTKTNELAEAMEARLNLINSFLYNHTPGNPALAKEEEHPEVPHFFEYFYSLKPKYLYYKQLQAENKKQLKIFAEEMNAVDQIVKGIDPQEIHTLNEKSMKQFKLQFSAIKPHLDKINTVLKEAQNQQIEAKITEQEAIEKAKSFVTIPKDYYAEVTFRNEPIYGKTLPIYQVKFLNEKKPRGQIVITVNGDNGQIVTLYNEMVLIQTKDEYRGKVITKDMKESLKEIARKATAHLSGKKVVIFPNTKRLKPEENNVWVVSEVDGVRDFSRYVQLSVNLTAKEVVRYYQHWPTQTVETLRPNMTKKQVMQQIREGYYTEPEMGKLIIAYSSYLDKPVLAMVYRDYYKKGGYHLVNADTGRVELPLYTISNQTTINDLMIDYSFPK